MDVDVGVLLISFINSLPEKDISHRATGSLGMVTATCWLKYRGLPSSLRVLLEFYRHIFLTPACPEDC